MLKILNNNSLVNQNLLKNNNNSILKKDSLTTLKEISINGGEPTKSVDLILLLIPISIQKFNIINKLNQNPSFLPIHLFPTISNREINTTIKELSKNYLKRLIYNTLNPLESKLDPISVLNSWYDLNLIYYLLQFWDYNLLKDLIKIVQRDIQNIHKNKNNVNNNSYQIPSVELSILVDMLNNNLNL